MQGPITVVVTGGTVIGEVISVTGVLVAISDMLRTMVVIAPEAANSPSIDENVTLYELQL
jgi:hypothetical protein